MQTMTISSIRVQTSKLCDPLGETLITRNGKPVAVVVGIDVYRSNQALLDLAKDPKRYGEVMAAHLRVQQDDFDDVVNQDELEKLLHNKCP